MAMERERYIYIYTDGYISIYIYICTCIHSIFHWYNIHEHCIYDLSIYTCCFGRLPCVRKVDVSSWTSSQSLCLEQRLEFLSSVRQLRGSKGMGWMAFPRFTLAICWKQIYLNLIIYDYPGDLWMNKWFLMEYEGINNGYPFVNQYSELEHHHLW